MALADEFAKGMMSTIGSISQQFPAVNREALMNAIAPGGSMASSLGFDDPKELLGMTPEAFQQSMVMRSQLMRDNMGMIKDMTALSDVVSGNTETRQAMYSAVPQIFGAQMQEGLQGKGFEHAKNMQDDSQAFAKEQGDLAWEREKPYRDAGLEIQRGQLGISQGHLALARKNFELAKQQQQQDAQYANNSFPAHTAWYNAYAKQKAALLRDDGVHLKEGADGNAFFNIHMKQSALGMPYGTLMDVGKYTKYNKGWTHMQLTPNGWYGLKMVNGKQVISPTPIIPMAATGYATGKDLSGRITGKP